MALALKEKGNALLAANDIEGAAACYREGLALRTQAQERTPFHLNLALCQAKQNKHAEAVESCTKALECEPGNVKALYRRAKSRLALAQLDGAAMDARTLLQINPKSAAGKELMEELSKAVKGVETGPRKMLGDACAPGADRTLLRQLIGLVHEDEARGAELSGRGGAKLLLDCALERDALAFVLLTRLASIPGFSSQQVAAALLADAATVQRVIDRVFDASIEDGHAAAGLSLLVRAQNAMDKAAAKAKTELAAVDPAPFIRALGSERVKLRETAIEACTTLFGSTEARALAFLQADGVEALHRVARDEPQLASVVLGKVLPRALGTTKAHDDVVFGHVERLCAEALDTKRAGSSDPEDMRAVRAGLSCLLAVLNASNELGLELVNKRPEHRQALVDAALHAPDATAVLAAEIFAQMASSEQGRAALHDAVLLGALHKLLSHSHTSIRSSASVALTKLEAVAFDGTSEQGMLVLGSVGGLLREGASQEEVRKGVEAVSFVVADTDVKTMLCTGDGKRILHDLCRTARALKPAAEAEEAKKAKKPTTSTAAAPAAANLASTPLEEMTGETAYALAFILSNLTMDEDDKKREKLREMEVTQEQWEKFEEMTKQKSRPGNSRKDSPEEVALRVDAVVEAGGVPALRSLLLHRGSPRIAACAAKTLANMAREQRLRGQMISQGAVGCLLRAHKLCGEGDKPDKTGTKDAAAALARLLITTDPRLLPNNHAMDAIGPLLEQVKANDEDVIEFESLMALTNIAVLGDEARRKIAQSKSGISTIEFAQFSETLPVRRAATELLSNLVPDDEFVNYLAMGDKVRLWLLLAEDWETDMATARAAAGCLASLAADPRTAAAMRRYGATDRLAAMCLPELCPHGAISHRAVVALVNLSECPWLGDDEAARLAAMVAPGAKAVSPSDAPKPWTAEPGPWSLREGEMLRATLAKVAAVKIMSTEYVPAQNVAVEWINRA